MSRERQNRRFRVAFAICMVLGLVEAALLMAAGGYFKGSVLQLVLTGLLCIGLGVLLGMAQWFFPYAIVVLGIAKLREQRREELEALGDENKVQSDSDGERKLGEYLTAITSTEARIGLLQRSNYVPLAERIPDAKIPRATISRPGWALIALAMLAGAASGVALGMHHGLTERESSVATVQLAVAALVGMVLASPVGVVLALIFGRVEEPDDARRSDQQAA